METATAETVLSLISLTTTIVLAVLVGACVLDAIWFGGNKERDQ